MNWLKEHEADSWILKGAIVFFLLFPAFYSLIRMYTRAPITRAFPGHTL